jgi:iron transport multicopper oxidase
MINGIVYGGFGGHCDLFNYTGMLVGVDTTKAIVTSIYAMESSPGAPTPQPLDLTVQQGGKAGIWQGGMGLATDGSRLFITTGNGQGHQNQPGRPASGRNPLTTLDEVVASFYVGSGKLALQDYFEPYEYINMDAADRDLGSGGTALLDPTVFYGTGVSRIAVTVGKNGKAYITNADNLGGFANGPQGTDGVIQTLIGSGAVFGGSGSYPLEGGYIYFTPVGAPTVAYSLGKDQFGGPLFSLVGSTPDNSAGRVGGGIPTVTSNKGQPGSGIVWMTDPDAGLRAYHAVPDATGKLVKINLPPTGGLNKFGRPAFGNGRLYVTNARGQIICLGSPVALPIQCNSPVDFGQVALGGNSTQTVSCTALINLNSVLGMTTGDPTFHVSNSTLPQGAVASGTTFTFPVLWDLSKASAQNVPNSSFGTVTPGVKSTSLLIYTNNAVAKYSTSVPVALTGTEVSKTAFLSISPPEVDMGGLVVGSSAAQSGLSSSFILANAGQMPMSITGYAFTSDLDVPVYTNVTFFPNGTQQVGPNYFTKDLPAVGSTLAPAQALTVAVTFFANQTGQYNNFLVVWTDGGRGYVFLVASATTAPIAELAIQTSEGGWDTNPSAVMDFGNVVAGQQPHRQIRICNLGGSALLITKSKPPVDIELKAENPSLDLHEGQSIPVNSCAYAYVVISSLPENPDMPDHVVSDFWTLNTDDPNFGVREVGIRANIVSRIVGPLNPDGSPIFRYLGCYKDTNPRNLPKQVTIPTGTNENNICQQTCFQNGYTFAGTEYKIECWCGNVAPISSRYNLESAMLCQFPCAGDPTQMCGGNGGYQNIYYNAAKYTPGCDSIPCNSTTTTTTTATTAVLPTTTATTTATDTTTTTTVVVPTTTTTTAAAVGPTIVPAYGNFTYIACWAEPATGRALPNRVVSGTNVSVEICLNACKQYQWAGVEYGRECWCGNVLNSASSQAANQLDCQNPNFLCTGNLSEYCGAGSRLALYERNDFILASSSSVVTTTTTTTTATAAASTTTTPAAITTTTTTTTPDAITTTTTTTTPAAITTTTTTTAAPASTTTTLATSTTSTTGASSANTPAPTMGFYYSGCYAEPPSGRAMLKVVPSNSSMALEFCIAAASSRRTAVPPTTYNVVGLEYAAECWGLSTHVQGQTSLVGNKACTMACKGNATESCGGALMYNYYVTSDLWLNTVSGVATGAPSPLSTTGTIGATTQGH